MTNELLKGTLKTIILKLLAEKGKMYGYEITQEVKLMTEGKIQITEGALYPALHALEAEGLLSTETMNIGKRVRKYYSLTKEGKNMVSVKLQEFVDFIVTMQSVLTLKPTL